MTITSTVQRCTYDDLARAAVTVWLEAIEIVLLSKTPMRADSGTNRELLATYAH